MTILIPCAFPSIYTAISGLIVFGRCSGAGYEAFNLLRLTNTTIGRRRIVIVIVGIDLARAYGGHGDVRLFVPVTISDDLMRPPSASLPNSTCYSRTVYADRRLQSRH